MKDLHRLLNPQSIAVFGVSHSNPFHPANVIYHKNRLRYRASTYGINPRGGQIYGETLYQQLEHIPHPVDLAVIAVRAEGVAGILRECIAAGLAGAIVISGGFAETGRRELQQEIADLCRGHAFPLIGPNCLGVFSPPAMDTFFLPPERLIEIRPGGVTLVSQSGGILVDLMIKLTQEGAGIARGISIGNRAVLDEVDLITFLRDDPRTRVIGLYLEGFLPRRGRDFVELVRQTDKPVVFLKAGKTPTGSRAVTSHTASVAGDYRVLHHVLAACGALEANDEAEFTSFCEALSGAAPRPLQKLAIITASGGHGAVAADECHAAGLGLPAVPAVDADRLRGELSPSIRDIASLGNPLDLTGSAADHDFLITTRHLLARDDIDGALMLLLPYLPAITPDLGARIAQISQENDKPIVTYIPHIDKFGIFIEGFEANGVAVSHSVQGAVHMMRALSQRGRS